MEYKLLTEITPAALSKVVTDHLEEGWWLHGSPVIVMTEDRLSWEYAQAVVINHQRRQS